MLIFMALSASVHNPDLLFCQPVKFVDQTLWIEREYAEILLLG
jgi:hypothetical protein